MRASLLILITIIGIFFSNINIQAQNVTWCLPGTGTDAVPCQPCIPGPYNICVPDTGIFDSFFENTENTSNIEIFAIGLLILGFILVINYFLIKKYFSY